MSGENQPAEDPFAPYRSRIRRSFWTLSLQPVEAGDILSPENHARVYELFGEDGVTMAVADARGEPALVVSIPEEQLAAFDEGEWRIGHRLEGRSALEILLVVGEQEPLECPFGLDLADESARQTAILFTERQEAAFLGVTHFEEGLMLTVKGEAQLPAGFREELRTDLLAMLPMLNDIRRGKV